ncbi:MAG: glycosidase [Gammaproteobacteria bacterium]|nr:glycosidase [Gammaproteobacteria bacterium]
MKDKNSCIFPRKIEDEYIILHRTNRSIYIDFVDKEQFLHGKEFLTTDYLLMRPRTEYWDNIKIGSAAAPIETKDGWLLFYHGYSDPGAIYKVGAVLLDLKDPREVLARTDVPLLQPEMEYEKFGFIHNVVFPCGVVVINGKIYMYYGAADFVIGVATMDLKQVLQVLKSS